MVLQLIKHIIANYANIRSYVILTFWFVASALEVYVLPAISVPEAVVGPEVCHKPIFEMFAVAVMKLLALENVAVLRSVFEEELVAAVSAARTTEPEPLVETSPACVVSAAAEQTATCSADTAS